MSLLETLRRMPDALCERRPGLREPRPLPRRVNGRRVPLGALYGFTSRTDPGRLGASRVIAAGAPLQHAVGQRRVFKEGRYVTESLVPEVISPSVAAGRLDCFLDLGDHAELAASWSMEHLLERIVSDRGLQAEIILRYLWGTESTRAWYLRARPDLELRVRLPPLLGWSSLEDLERCLGEVFELCARMTLDLEAPDAKVGNLASPLHARGTPKAASRRGTRAGPPVVGPAPLRAPALRAELEPEGDELALEYGFDSAAEETKADARPGWSLLEAVARCYLPPHVEVIPSRGREAEMPC